MRCLIVAALCLIAAACDQQSILESITTAEDRAFALQVIRALQAGDTKTVVEHMPQEMAAKIELSVPNMRELLPSDPAAPARLVDARVEVLTAARKVDLAYAMDEGTRHVLIRLVLVRVEKDVFLRGLHVSPLPRPIEELTPFFALSGKSLGQYLFFLFALLSAATIVTALYVLYRAENVGRKWPWAIGCAFGVGQFTMNWTSGEIEFNTLSIQLFGVVAVKAGALAPWHIGFGIPLVAYVFLLRQAHARVRARDSAT